MSPLPLIHIALATPAYAACANGNPSESSAIGYQVTHPDTGACVTVAGTVTYKDAGFTDSDVGDADAVVYLVTADGEGILVKSSVSDIIFEIDTTTGETSSTLKEIASVTVDSDTGLPASVKLMAVGADPDDSGTVFTNYASYLSVSNPPQDTPGELPVTPTTTTVGFINEVHRAGGGKNGRNGYIFGGGGDGHNGSAGPTVNRDVETSHGAISTTEDGKAGIEVASIGGKGGNGGSAYSIYGNGGDGGIGGAGGDVIFTNDVMVSTSGDKASAINIYSQAGKGGSAGSGGLIGDGGSGGASRNGGEVTVDNTGGLFTTGDNSHGIRAFSSGGAGGSGGNSWAIVGSGGTGASAGDGGNVTVVNAGEIGTTGDNAYGIFAQSVGGTGGDGGSAGGLVALGGGAASGGQGGNVDVTLKATSNIQTRGQGSTAVLAQSVGGGGGDGGGAGGIVAFGASSGSGNDAGRVTVSTEAGSFISTEGQSANAIQAQSIGGGGGSGGSSGGAVAFGGSGSSGGDGDTVSVTNRGTIHTNCTNPDDGTCSFSRGIFAQSIGGGGGSGGTAGGLVNLGGSGSGGGDAGAVTILNEGTINSHGDFSDGIFAQSIGGGGGAAGNAFGAVNIGGTGGGGGSAGTVTVNNSGNISTEGEKSRGIFAQSIGGGGGTGGDAGGIVNIGGAGSAAGNAGDVTVTNSGFIATDGKRADGIFAQSIGGGGGDGGSGAGLVSIGGAGSTGGSAGEVTVTNEGQIVTEQDEARGIFAQSVGGGGGNGGGGTAGSLFVGFALGGAGGNGGDGETVTVNLDKSGATAEDTTALIYTKGDRATGILAQSVGGGGGSGGDAIAGSAGFLGSVSVAIGGQAESGGEGGEVTLSGAGRIRTEGELSSGVVLQSVGGGGGNGGMSIAGSVAAGPAAGAVSVSLGGEGGNGGAGGLVHVDDANLDIWTIGDQSTGFLAQSVGGGGGNGGLSVAASAANGATASGSVSVGLGGDGGEGGEGGTVDVAFDGVVRTEGDQSDGVVIQSVGGGGGNGGLTVAANLAVGGVGSGTVSLGLGGSGAKGGNAGTATADVNADIETDGDGSDGLVVQSVGGGGGNGGLSVTAGLASGGSFAGSIGVGIGGSGAEGGDGNVVDANYEGTLVTLKDNSTGILAQSVGGGGGNGGGNVTANLTLAGSGGGTVGVGLGGTGGGGGNGGADGVDVAVTLTTAGSVYTSGDNSTGIVAQSVGGGGGNGGFNITANAASAGTGAVGVAVGIGGSGGDGGNGKGVVATIGSNVSTKGDNAGGVVIQSVGGGGGSGGLNVSVAMADSGSFSGAVGVGIGGTGGNGGNAGAVTSDLNSEWIVTEGKGSTGLLVQSVGGGGGNGGLSVAGTIAAGGISGGVSVGIGGSGGGGGNAGSVTNTVVTEVLTIGDESKGIVAQSVGGGGGNGGLNVSGAVTLSSTGGGAIGVGLGGAGGDAGAAGTVNNDVTGNVTTNGKNAAGIIAQSAGGGGGTGATNVTGTVSLSRSVAGAIGVGIGGSGGDGGQGSSVTNHVVGDVATFGDSSAGIIAQSLGGGGGDGGVNITGGLAVSKSASGVISVGIGGSGGTGGQSSTVTNTVVGNVYTEGDTSTGILAQSLGGGGGNGALNVSGSANISGSSGGTIGVGIGGSGGGGGTSGAVTNNVTGDVTTRGEDSSAIVAQSIGGGGGNGGTNITGGLSITKSTSGTLGVGVGGFGGDGGNAGTVTSTVEGHVYTSGESSRGVVAQSIGGGGGNGGLNVSGSISASVSGSSGNSIGASIGIGGFGGGGGNANTVTSDFTGTVQTTGDKATAVFAQSLGGGGGNGGTNVSGSASLSLSGSSAAIGIGVGGFGGDGGQAGNVTSTVTISPDGAIQTLGDDASGIVAQSLGGGGGNGGTNISGALSITDDKSGASIGIGVGGFGGGGGDAGDATVNATGNIFTSGSNSHGIVAQSLAGGGGNGGLNVSGTLGVSWNGGNTTNASIGVGGFGGSGGDAGDASITYEGTINTPWTDYAQARLVPDDHGATGSHGLMAQSIGGGGGNGAINVSGSVSYSRNPTGSAGNGNALVLGVGGFGGGGGDAGDVSVTVAGGNSITAHGNDAAAIFAQSVGGGGGNGGMNFSAGFTSDMPLIFGVGGFGGDGGTAGTVTVNATTDLYADGTKSAGVFAQSLGGAGGNGALSITGGGSYNSNDSNSSLVFGIGGFGGTGNVSSDVTVSLEGVIRVQGDEGHGIFAQSIGGGGGNGGLNVAAGVNWTSDTASSAQDFSLVGGIGGFAGDGANSGDVTVNNIGAISVIGDQARGVFAQAIGGGGGTGGINVTTHITKQANPISFGMGGFGGGGGDAGDVTVTRGDETTNAGIISTGKTVVQTFSVEDELGVTAEVDVLGTASHGIEASSIGGGGGDAGINLNVTYSTAGKSSSGDGTSSSDRPVPANTGVDASVIANYNKVLDELEKRQSGNKVDDAKTTPTKDAYALNLAIGGDGGSAGDGGDVTVFNNSGIETFNNSSHGILAQSIGGGGGNATFNVALAKQSDTQSVNVALGGAVGDGGIGGEVTVTQIGDITTHGADSVGVLAQSLGGGGGNAGMTNMTSSTDAGKLTFTLGRQGGTGGSGGNVSVIVDGDIATSGDNAYGIQAQSVGNGGGNSSATSFSASRSKEAKDSTVKSVSISVGLQGGTGGFAGEVDVDASGSVSTSGANAFGILAQSIGGGGGNASTAGVADRNSVSSSDAVALKIGGDGGVGGYASAVTVTSDAIVLTQGDRAIGILAQSIGGGGGTGGSINLSGVGSISSPTSAKALTGSAYVMGVGGDGGEGAEGGTVVIDHEGIVVTNGSHAHGILAQSIGGGGGQAGGAESIILANGVKDSTTKQSNIVSISVGGDGGKGAVGGNVEIENSGTIETFNETSIGIFAQSIGGGGGNAAATNSVGRTKGVGTSVNIALGGDGATGGYAGNVTVTNLDDGSSDHSGWIVTHGAGSHGIAAMSIGGGGGTVDTTMAGNLRDENGRGLALAVGGDGGTGGAGGVVLVENEGTIMTFGDGAHGILAQSVGGGGGNAALTTATSLKADENSNVALSVGGSGGDGNVGGDVTVRNSGTIYTEGEGSYGILAQSVGGGGGDGDFTASTASDTFNKTAQTFRSLALGGQGGDGGDSGNVLVEHTGSITVTGDNSYGIYAQSVSGGGGSMGYAISAPITAVLTNALNATLGGDGSKGLAGTVTLSLNGDINISGNNSHAIFMQSVNGGGGDVQIFQDLSLEAQAAGEGTVDIEDNLSTIEEILQAVDQSFIGDAMRFGADKVEDAEGALVNLVQKGQTAIVGDNSIASVVQSIGGGGGFGNIDLQKYADQDSEFAGLLGALDSDNNDGGDVFYEYTGTTATRGDGSGGAVIQSVGGGGGSLLLDVEELPTPTSAPSGQAAGSRTVLAAVDAPYEVAEDEVAPTSSFALGATGGKGNDGGHMNVKFSGDTFSDGSYAPGIIVQSIGAGGGQARLFGLDRAEVSIGGQSGAKGDGGAVTLSNTGIVATEGTQSHGIVLQSIGGGGGLVLTDMDASDLTVALSGANSGDGGKVSLTQTGDVSVNGAGSIGVALQSLGGGGGLVQDIFAGTAGGAGDAGDVSLSLKGNVFAEGNASRGILAQSEGAYTAGDIKVSLGADLWAIGDNATGAAISSKGGQGAGDISLSLAKTLNVVGNQSTGIEMFAGGGESAGNISLSLNGNVSVVGSGSVGISATSEGDLRSGDISVTLGGRFIVSSESLATDEDAAEPEAEFAVKRAARTVSGAASVPAEPEPATGIELASRGARTAGNVSLVLQDLTEFYGDGGQGISLVSSGGLRSGNVNLSTNDDVLAYGDGSTAIYAESTGGEISGDIEIITKADTLVYAGAGGTAIAMVGGRNNKLTVNGVVSTADGLAGMAVTGTSGNDTIITNGYIYGQIDLGEGVNKFTNAASGDFIAGAKIALGGVRSMMTNDGDFVIGGAGVAQTTEVEGSFTQTAHGNAYAEIDFADDSVDQLHTSGTLSLDGDAVVSLLNVPLIRAGSFSKSLFVAEMGVSDHGLELVTAPSMVISYDLVQRSDTAIDLEYDVDFAPSWLGENLSAVGRYFNDVQAAGSAEALAPTVVKLVGDGDEATYRASLSQMSPDIYAEDQAGLVFSARRFGNQMLNCRTDEVGSAKDSDAFCAWASFETEDRDRKAYGDYKDFSQRLHGWSAGLQRRFGDHWSIGLAGAMHTIESDGYDENWRSQGDLWQFGLSARYSLPATDLSAAFSVGLINAKTTREGAVALPFVAESDRSSTVLNGVLRANHSFSFSAFYAKPELQLGVTQVRAGRADETGADSLGLLVAKTHQTYAWARPSVEVGGNWAVTSSVQLGGFAQFGLERYLGSHTSKVMAQLAGAPADAGGIAVGIDMGKQVRELTAGLRLASDKGWQLSASYEWQRNDIYSSDTALVKLAVPF